LIITFALLGGITQVYADYHIGGRDSGYFLAYYDSSMSAYGYTTIYDYARSELNGASGVKGGPMVEAQTPINTMWGVL